MSRLFYHTMQDNAGNLLFDVSGTMRLAGTGTLATIYGDEALSIPIANPMTNHPSYGSFKCYLPPGNAYDFYMAKAGYTFETLTGIQGLGTMAQQNATSVAITGGSATLGAASVTAGGSFNVDSPTLMVDGVQHTVGVGVAPQPEKFAVSGLSYFNGQVGIGERPVAGMVVALAYLHASQFALRVKPTDSDAGPGGPAQFHNAAGTAVGSIVTTNTTTTYSTTSDARLKHDVETLTGELDLLKLLRPVRFLWNADDSPGVGFLAHEVAAHVQGVITGDEGALNEDGSIRPQMIDPSKLVPYLVGAIQSLAARLVVLEDALGI